MNTDFARFVRECPEFLTYANFQEVGYSINISMTNRLVFFNLPKNGSSTVKNYLHQIEYRDGAFCHASNTDVHDRNFSPLLTPFQVPSFRAILENPGFLKFCVFRNPYERLLSSYLDKVRQKIVDTSFIRQVLGVDGQHDLSFEEFVYGVSHQEYSQMDPHWRIQYLQSFAFAVPTMKTYSLLDLKNFSEEIAAHARVAGIGIKTVAPHRTAAIEKIPQLLTSDLAQIIRRKFALDFDWAKSLGFDV